LTEQQWLSRLPEEGLARLCMTKDWAAAVAGRPTGKPAVMRRAEQLAYVIYTSGSSGKPKGVMIEHRQVSNYVRGMRERLGLDETRRLAMVQPLTVDSSVTVLYGALSWGGSLHVIGKQEGLDGEALAGYCRGRRIDGLKIAPTHMAGLLKEAGGGGEWLRGGQVVMGGEASSWELIEELGGGRRCAIYNHYGPTETTVGVLRHKGEAGERGGSGSGTVWRGRPVGEVRR